LLKEPIVFDELVAPVAYDRDWLLSQCEIHLSLYEANFDPTTLCTDIFTLLQNSNQIETDLVDLLGYENFEFISTLIENKVLILSNIIKTSQRSTTQALYQYGTTVTITTQKEKDEQKSLRKAQRKQHQTQQAAEILGFDGLYLKTKRQEQLLQNKNQPMFSNKVQTTPEIVYPNVYQSRKNTSYGNVLPEGTTREDGPDQEEITMPCATIAPIRTNESLKMCNEFDDWIKPVYKGYKSLNRIQSIVFPIAFETNENMLVCAPTVF
jgi:hypothetical protein